MSIKHHIPNALTFFRYACVPLLLIMWPLNMWAAFAIVLLACISDFLDGYLARLWMVESALGRLLDPNADKLIVATALILLCTSGDAPVVAVVLILCRELFVSALRESMAERQIIIHVSKMAKWKTATQMIAVLVLMLGVAMQHDIVLKAGESLLWLATGLTLWTGWDYFKGSIKQL